ncbi:aminopeptidase [Streptococcus agalactiae]|nr:aminopeptidase [Streptococcus agalactiae]
MVLQDFDNLLKKYAQLIISKGLNVQKGTLSL